MPLQDGDQHLLDGVDGLLTPNKDQIRRERFAKYYCQAVPPSQF